ncbi:MAG TPA: type I polyketide synthase, partial [Solirubrobacteraceae bacterium]
MGDRSAIALVGIACRVPGAGSPDAFWRLLRDGVNMVREVPAGRQDPERRLGLAELGPGARYGGFLEQVDRFDAAFFGISPREAASMDPQQRLMLELCWESFEDARVAPSALAGSQTGVFVGAISSDYADLLHGGGEEALTRHAATGLNRGMIANRVSYTLGLRGPSLTVDTGQSSSLVAVHLACESLRRGESTQALACGVHLNISAASTLKAASFGGLSPDGRCFTFDARANGYVRGEGGGVVLLKPLSDALAAGDPIYCVIRGSAVNNDGGGDGLTSPSQSAQEEALRLAYRRAAVKCSEVGYVELHGTGTVVGDRVEAAALGGALGSARAEDRPLLVGSVKTNIGHLEGAAGIAGLLKAALCISHRLIPPSLNFESPRPDIPLGELHLRVQSQPREWTDADGPLLAGVSSFGLGGTNCHVVLGEPPRAAVATSASGGARSQGGQADVDVSEVYADGAGLSQCSPPALSSHPLGDGALAWLISGRSDLALSAQARTLTECLERDGELAAADAVGYSLATTRTAFEHRAVVHGTDREQLLDGMRALGHERSAANLTRGAVSQTGGRAVFVFPGQGSQWQGMALELLDSSPVFATAMRTCAAALSEYVDWSVYDVLQGAPDAPGLDRIGVVQPILFAVMVSLAELWRACGVQPAAVVGHSQGEVPAACLAGALSLEDGARIVAQRSKLLEHRLVGHGTMAWIASSSDDVEARCERWEGRVSVAAVNAPSSVVVSGQQGPVSELLKEYASAGVRVREVLGGAGAGHSPHVEWIREDLLDSLAGIRPRRGDLPFYSTVTGGLLDHAALDAGYWYRNAREPVRFEQTIRALVADGQRVFLEISPHPILTAAMQDTFDAGESREDLSVALTLKRGDGGSTRFLRSLADLWVRGIDVDWGGVLAGANRPTVALPTYAFQRE